MKIFHRLTILLILLLTGTMSSYADHIGGNDLTYSCTSTPGVYQLTYVFYRTCTGIALCPGGCTTACTFGPLNITGADVGCYGTSYGSVTLNLVSVSDVGINALCPTAKNICNNNGCATAGTFSPGMEKYIFQGTVNLGSGSGIPGTCCNVNISWYSCCRSAEINTGATWQGYYTYCTINRCITPCASSPRFNNDAVAILCNGAPFVYNMGAFDPDRDSLSYSFVPSLQTAGSSVTYISPYSAQAPMPYYAPASAPFPLGIHCDSLSGDISFTPAVGSTTTFVGIMAVQVNKWRTINGTPTIIGLVRREMQMWVISCAPNNSPRLLNISHDTLNVITNPFITKTSWSVYGGQTLCFDIIAKDTDFNPPTVSDTTFLTWDYALAQYGATFTSNYVDSLRKINGPREDSKKFCWTPDTSKSGTLPWYFTVTARDPRCPISGIVSKSFAITVIRPPYFRINKTAASCFRWNYTYTTNVSSSLISSVKWQFSNVKNIFDSSTCTTITSQNVTNYAFPDTGKYVYRLRINSGSSNSFTVYDTMNVSFKPISLSALQPDSSLCKNTALTYRTKLSGGKPPITNRWYYLSGITPLSTADTLYLANTSAGLSNYIINSTDSIGCIVRDTFKVNVNSLPAINLTTNMRICNGSSQLLDPGNNNGNVKTYVWSTGDTTRTITKRDSGQYSLLVTDTNRCQATGTVMLYVNNPIIPQVTKDTTLCGIKTIGIFASGGQNYQWRNMNTNTIIDPKTAFPYFLVTPTSPTYYEATVYVSQSGLECSVTDTVFIKTDANPPLSILSPTMRICKGSSFTLDPGNNAGRPVKYLWNTGDTSRTITRSDSNLFIVTLTDTFNCRVTDSLPLFVNNPVVVFAGNDSTICANKSITLHATGTLYYQWKNLNTNTIIAGKSTNPNTIVTVNSLTVFEVTGYVIQNSIECTNKDTVIISVTSGSSIYAGTPKVFCNYDPPFNLTLTQAATPAGGIWAGTGVSTVSGNYIFNPANANLAPAVNKLYYTLNNPLCSNYDSIIFTVNAKPPVPFITGPASVQSGKTNNYYVSNNAGSTFNWFTTNGNITGGQGTSQVSVVFSSVGTGNMKIFETASTSCKSDTAIKTVAVTAVGGISEQNVFDHFNVYPNPTTGVLNIEFETNEKNIELEVVDMIGRSIMKVNAKHNGGLFQKSLDLSAFNQGIYFVKLSAGEKNVTVKITLQ